MKKTFKLKIDSKNQDRLLESIKHEIRKYIKREKRKPLVEGVDFWKLECKFAKNDDVPTDINFEDIMKHINEASTENCNSFYMEIISTKGKSVIKEKKKVQNEGETLFQNSRSLKEQTSLN